MKNQRFTEAQIASIFIIIPTIFSLLGIFYFKYPLAPWIKTILPIPLFSGLILLFIGAYIPKKTYSTYLRILGWIVFSFYWATQPNTLYWAEQQDLVNAFLVISGIYVLNYLAYHEWYAKHINQEKTCLQWIAGASAISGLIYFIIDPEYFGNSLIPLGENLILIVAQQSGWLLTLLTGGVVIISNEFITYNLATIRIIFACTAVQSMVIFVGMILPLQKVAIKRKTIGILVTVLPVYILNLFRNVMIIYLVGIYGSGFFSIAHNIIGKGGSLIALVILLFILIKIVPEVFDEILALTDLPKVNGPIEKAFRKIIGRKK